MLKGIKMAAVASGACSTLWEGIQQLKLNRDSSVTLCLLSYLWWKKGIQESWGSLSMFLCQSLCLQQNWSCLPCSSTTVAVLWIQLGNSQGLRTRSESGWDGKNLCRPCGPSPMLKQGHPEMISQACVQMAFEYLHGWRFNDRTGQLSWEAFWNTYHMLILCQLTLGSNRNVTNRFCRFSCHPSSSYHF